MKHEPIDTFTHAGRRVEIYQDIDPESPASWDNAGTLVIEGDWGTFADESRAPENRTCDGWETEIRLRRIFAHELVIPVRFSDYGSSGATLYECDPDDANGIIYCTPEEIDAEWSSSRDDAERYLLGRIEETNQYLQGDVYGFVISDEAGNHLDSCWGFYGYDYAVSEAKGAAEANPAPTPDQLAKLLLPAINQVNA